MHAWSWGTAMRAIGPFQIYASCKEMHACMHTWSRCEAMHSGAAMNEH